jgi:hypothetical protein
MIFIQILSALQLMFLYISNLARDFPNDFPSDFPIDFPSDFPNDYPNDFPSDCHLNKVVY